MSARRGPFFWLSLVCAAVVAITIAPFISVLIVYAIASPLGCTVNEGGATPCLFMGVDLGDTLLTMMMLGWLGLLTLPVGAVAVLVWLIGWLGSRWQRRRRTA